MNIEIIMGVWLVCFVIIGGCMIWGHAWTEQIMTWLLISLAVLVFFGIRTIPRSPARTLDIHKAWCRAKCDTELLNFEIKRN